MKYYLAIDLGASSGRHVVGHNENGKIVLEEIHRFRTCMDDSKDGLVWNLPRIFNEIVKGIRKAFDLYPSIESLSIDTWGVDYVLLDEKGKEIKPFYAYRNERCAKAAKLVHEVIPFEELYKVTGIQYASFNTLYQLYSDKLQGRLDKASDYLMLPCYFMYKLTGIKMHEYTNETTGAIIDPKTNEYAYSVIDKLGLPRKLFKKINKPGDLVGDLLPEIQRKVGGNCKVILCATHDTGSAFEAVDAPEDAVILSSGTWSLLGIKTKTPIVSKESLDANYTNEGGVNYIRFLKNIMGMYLANRVREEVNLTYPYIDSVINDSTYKETFDVNDESLSAPKDMKKAILNLLKNNPPKDDIDIFASIYRSLAYTYKVAIEKLEGITGKKYHSIFIVGGGAKNVFLNKLIKEYTNLEANALPIEATALGNIKIQMKASK